MPEYLRVTALAPPRDQGSTREAEAEANDAPPSPVANDTPAPPVNVLPEFSADAPPPRGQAENASQSLRSDAQRPQLLAKKRVKGNPNRVPRRRTSKHSILEDVCIFKNF